MTSLRARVASSPVLSERIAELALAANARWTREVIEAGNYCPFARRAREQQRATALVSFDTVDLDQPERSADGLFAHADRLANDERAEVVQVIFPLLEVTSDRWQRYAKGLTAAVHRRRGQGSVFAVAAFHPELPWSGDGPQAIVPLLRRTPDPTIQWLRLDVLHRVREGRPEGDVVLPDGPEQAQKLLKQARRPSLSEVVAQANWDTARGHGLDALEARLRELSHAAQAQYADAVSAAV